MVKFLVAALVIAAGSAHAAECFGYAQGSQSGSMSCDNGTTYFFDRIGDSGTIVTGTDGSMVAVGPYGAHDSTADVERQFFLEKNAGLFGNDDN